MRITCYTHDDRSTQIEVEAAATFGDIKAILSVEFQTTPEKITLSYKGDNTIPDSETVGNQGITDNEMLFVVIKNNRMPVPAMARTQGANQGQNILPPGATPGLGTLDALLPPQFRGLDFNRLFGGTGARTDAENQQNRSNAEAIRRNYETAMQESPENFVPVYMLYIDVLINDVPVKAFVDSGAQTTVMSKACAIRTKVIDLIDPRFAGIAMGVGQARIMGKVHIHPIKIGGQFYNCSFSVLDAVQNVDLLIGLDILKKYQCNIDLANDCLHFGSTDQTIPFLPESELPPHARLR